MQKTGTSPQTTPRRQASDGDSAASVVKQSPPPPGMGKLVDKTA
jgi:hypothetical protein